MLRNALWGAKSYLSSGAWSSVTFGEKQKLFKLHTFLFVQKGKTYSIEVQEGVDGSCEVHAVNTSDDNEAIPSLHGSDVKKALQSMISQLEGRNT